MKKKLIIILFTAVFPILAALSLTACDLRSDEAKDQQSREVSIITVVDVETGDTIQIELSGNPGSADVAYKKK